MSTQVFAAAFRDKGPPATKLDLLNVKASVTELLTAMRELWRSVPGSHGQNFNSLDEQRKADAKFIQEGRNLTIIEPVAQFQRLFNELLALWPSEGLNYEHYGRVDIIAASKNYSAGLLEETIRSLELGLDSLNKLMQSQTEQGLLDELEFDARLTALLMEMLRDIGKT